MEKVYRGVIPMRIETDDIENLSTAVCNELRCGDSVVKITGNQKHHYRVSYKEEEKGLCLTYVDASCAETVSYDYNTETKAWAFNSKDVTVFSQE